MVAKRQAGRQGARVAKKARMDPVSEKVKEVMDALSHDDCELAGPTSYRESLLAGFPLAMGLGAAKDERHAYQDQLANIVLEVLKATEEKFQGKWKAAKAGHAAAEESKSSKEAAVTQAESVLEEQRKMEKEARDTLLSTSEAVIEAKKTLTEATSEVENFDTIQLAKAKERAEFGSALENEFQTLKTGACDDAKEKKSLLSRVGFVLKNLGVDQGLCSAATPALTKTPDARGPFDNTVVEQVEAALKARVESLSEDLSNGETLKAKKMAEQTTAQEALVATEAKMAQNQTTVTEADTKTKEFETAVVQAKATLAEHESTVQDMENKAFYEQCHVETIQGALQAFEFLRDRASTVPEAEAEKASILLCEEAIAMEEVNLVV